MSRTATTPKTRAKATGRKALSNAATVGPMAMPKAGSLSARVRAMNRFREQYNPLVGLTLTKARSLFESYPRGEFAELMWTYGAPMLGIESSDADLLALIERRSSALLEMDWQVKVVDTKRQNGTARRDFDEVLAEEQAAALSEAYEGIANIYEAIEHLAIATFRGFSHAEKCCNYDGDITRLEIVDQWNVVRDGLKGPWKYNPEALSTDFRSLPAEYLIDPCAFVIRQVARPVNRIALLKWIRAGLSEKDWDAFIEIYGIPSGVVTMPPNVPADQQDDFLSAAEKVAEGGSGALPNGATYTANDSPRGVNPFAERLRYLSEKLILAGTGGLLTMLTSPTGIGSGASDAHSDTFQMLARKEARAISELFQRQIDTEILARKFPGRPTLAYWTLSLNEETDTTAIVQDVSTLSSAGFRVDPEVIEERTGYPVSIVAPAVPSLPGMPSVPGMRNRATEPATGESRPPLQPFERDEDLPVFLGKAQALLAEATAADLQPLRDAIAELLQASDDELPDKLAELQKRLPEIGKQVITAKGADNALYESFSAALASALAGANAPQA